MSSSLQQIQITSDIELRDVLDQFKKEILLGINCHHIGTIQSFDSDLQTATASINYTKTFFKLNAGNGNYLPYQKQYPLLIDAPVICLGGGKASLTFPISAGDECLIIFNDRNMDNWFSGGSGSQLATGRLHSFSDGIILVGLRSMANTIDNYDNTRAVLQNGTTMVGVGESLIKIANRSTTLNTLLQQILTQLETLANSVCVPSSPLNPAVATALALLATQLGELIE